MLPQSLSKYAEFRTFHTQLDVSDATTLKVALLEEFIKD